MDSALQIFFSTALVSNAYVSLQIPSLLASVSIFWAGSYRALCRKVSKIAKELTRISLTQIVVSLSELVS